MQPHTSTTVVIMQPYFLPYRNYYGLIRKADYFVVYDDVQFCRKWQQRNSILCEGGTKAWLTLPVVSRRPSSQLINEVALDYSESWQGKMLSAVRRSYQAHPFFRYVYPELEELLRARPRRLLDALVPLLEWSTSKVGLEQPDWLLSSDLGGRELGRTERLVHICRSLGATEYLCGPAAKVYLDEGLFASAGVKVTWHEETYPDYPQRLSGAFDHYVSVLDLLMNCGPESYRYLEAAGGL